MGRLAAVEKMVIANWYLPEEKLPSKDVDFVVVTFSGKNRNITADHALGVAMWSGVDPNEEQWTIEGWSGLSDIVIHAWCDLEAYQGGKV